LLAVGILAFGLSLALSIAYGTAWLGAKIILPDSIDVDAIVAQTPFLKRVLHAALVLASFTGTFGGLYVAYLLVRIPSESD
jgi:uncharacterized membrane protein (DUF485 family)